MSYKFLPLLLLSILFINCTTKVEEKQIVAKKTIVAPKYFAENAEMTFEVLCKTTYTTIDKNNYSLPNYESFSKAFEGYEKLKSQGKVENEILTIIDFSLSSIKERMWVIDMKNQKIIFQTLVAHGMKSGMEYAKSFSNENNSNKSSLGFYLTGETYGGKHGLSLKLDGQEYGLNHSARERAVVIHGADYVSKKLANQQGFIGRSQGCPAVPEAITKKLIKEIKNKSVVYIYHPSRVYFSKSKLTS